MLCSFQVYRTVSQLHTHIYIFFFRFFSCIGYYEIYKDLLQNRPLLIFYFFYTAVCIC